MYQALEAQLALQSWRRQQLERRGIGLQDFEEMSRLNLNLSDM